MWVWSCANGQVVGVGDLVAVSHDQAEVLHVRIVGGGQSELTGQVVRGGGAVVVGQVLPITKDNCCRRLPMGPDASTPVHQHCECSLWRRLDRVGRDLVLAEFADWAWISHRVEIALLVRGRGVVIAQLTSHQRGQGRTRVVLAALCNWSDCARVRVRLELTPTDQYGADLARLTRFYHSLGFGGDLDPEPWLGIERPGLLVRYPASPRPVGRVRVIPPQP